MKNKIISIGFVCIIGTVFIINIFTADKLISNTERRKLKVFPKITLKGIMDKSVMNDFESYTLDQFVSRDFLRSLKSYSQFYLFNKNDNNNLYYEDGYIFKSEYPTNNKSITNFINKINNIYDKYLDGMNVYYSIIPDKNYYLNSDKYLNIDYEYLFSSVNDGLRRLNYIDIKDKLELSDFYKTDTHWKQDKLIKVVKELGNSMGFSISESYQEVNYSNFYGVYYGQLALNVKPDTLTYLTNSIINESTVYNLESDYTKVYNNDKLSGMDPYDVYLSGATPFIEIKNPKVKDKELVIFRDSFGSSISPLLIEAYSKITLIDIRYIDTINMEKLIEFDNQDVLFLYSTLIINNSGTLKN